MSKILKISDASSLAMHTMGLLASEPGKVFSNREAASTLGVSEAHLSKVMQRMARGGYISSTRGPRGGFKLAKPAKSITLLEIFEQIEGPLAPSECLLAKKVCGGDRCILGGLLENVNGQVQKYLSETKLSDIVDVYRSVGDGKKRRQ
ncbi:MAG: Rrf2 family transcriptional regulator [bacterium]